MKTGLKLFILALLLAASASCKFAGRAFGPKDEGGIYLIIAVKADAAQLDRAVARTIEVMRTRCERLNIYCKAERVGGDRIKLNVSVREDPERLKGVILSQGLELRAVVSPPSPGPLETYPTERQAAEAAGSDKDVLPYDQERGEPGAVPERSYIVVEREPIVTGLDVREAEAVPSHGGAEDYAVTFKLSPEGAARFGNWTGSHVNQYMAVVLNKQVRSVAYIKSQIYDTGQITGRFTRAQAEDTALVLNSGGLPAPIEALEEGLYRP